MKTARFHTLTQLSFTVSFSNYCTAPFFSFILPMWIFLKSPLSFHAIVYRFFKDNKIFYSIVYSVSVYVMDTFRLFKFAIKKILHNISMFINIFTVNSYPDIPVFHPTAPTFPGIMRLHCSASRPAGTITKFSCFFPIWIYKKVFSTVFTSQFHLGAFYES